MTVSRKDEEKFLSPEFLDEIKRVRESRGISIEEVAEKTNIKSSYIKAIEDGDLSKLPGGVYTKAYVKSISEFLGIAIRQYERKYDPENDIQEKQVRIELGQPTNASMPSKVIIIGCLFVIFVLYSVFYGPRHTKDEDVKQAVETYKDKQTEKAQQQQAQPGITDEQKAVIQAQLKDKVYNDDAILNKIPVVSPVQKSTEANLKKDIVLTVLAVAPATVQVKDAYGKVVLNKQMQASEAIMLDASQEYYLYTNAISNLGVYIDGVLVKDLSKVERSGQALKFSAKSLVETVQGQEPVAAVPTTTQPAQTQTAAPQAATPAQTQQPAAKPTKAFGPITTNK